MMNRKWLMLVGIAGLALTVTTTGCGKKKPPATPAPEEVSVPTMEEPAETDDMTMGDEVPIWDQELEAVNRAAYEQGLLGDVYFDFDRYELKPEALDRLARNAQFMQEHPEFIFTIEGHCDERGTNEYNLALGDRRSSAARNYLTSLGVDGSRMTTISYGEERPQCMNSDESCWQLNRRAHFVITGRG